MTTAILAALVTMGTMLAVFFVIVAWGLVEATIAGNRRRAMGRKK